MKTILVPLDFSEVSNAVVTEAAALARALDGRVVLLTIMQSPALTAQSLAVAGDIGEMAAAGERFATQELRKYVMQLAADGVPAESQHYYGGPIEHIVEQAAERSADYVVMGSHGHTALYDLLVGSTTHGVLQGVTCPVVIVPALAPARRPAGRKAEPATA